MALLQRALAIQKMNLGEAHEDTILTMVMLMVLTGSQQVGSNIKVTVIAARLSLSYARLIRFTPAENRLRYWISDLARMVEYRPRLSISLKSLKEVLTGRFGDFAELKTCLSIAMPCRCQGRDEQVFSGTKVVKPLHIDGPVQCACRRPSAMT